MEDDLNICENGRRTELFFVKEDDLNFNINIKQFEVKTMIVAPLRVT